MAATASIANAAGFDPGFGITPANIANAQKFSDIIVAALMQASVSPEVQASAFTEALTQALAKESPSSEAADVIIIAAIAANQVDSISQAFASPQVWSCLMQGLIGPLGNAKMSSCMPRLPAQKAIHVNATFHETNTPQSPYTAYILE